MIRILCTPIILSSITAFFPNIEFFRPNKDRIHWLIKAIVGGSALGIMLYLLNWLFSLAGDIIKGVVH
jgi:flagellar biosynthesis protein FliR